MRFSFTVCPTLSLLLCTDLSRYTDMSRSVSWKGCEMSRYDLFSSSCVSVPRGECGGLDSKYFGKREDTLSIYGVSSNQLHRGKSMLLI